MNGGIPSKGLNETLLNILDQLESDSNLLDNSDNIKYIISLLGEGADKNTKNQAGKTLSDYLNEKLSDILNKLESNRALLGNHNCTQHIMLLLEAGADPNTTGTQGEKTLSDYSSEKLRDILNQSASNSDLLDNPGYIQHIMFLLQAGADPNTTGTQGEKTLSDYSSEKLRDILNQLASNSDLLDNPGYIQHIMFLLGAVANSNTQTRNGKTLLHYVAERNDTVGIDFLLGKRADPNVQDHSGRTPFEYVTERECRQAIKDLGYDLDDSHENEGNPTTPDGSVGESNDCSNSSGDDSQIESVKLSDCNTEEDSDYHSDGSCENKGNPANGSSNDPKQHYPDKKHIIHDDQGYGSGDDNKTISTEPSDCDRKDEDSSCSSSDYLFLEDSLLAKLEIPLTTDEQELIDKFCEEIRGITAQNKQESEESILESIDKIVNKYLEKGLRLNSSCSNGNEKGDKETVTSLILEEMADVINRSHVSPRNSTVIRDPYNYDDPEEGDGKECQALDTIIKEITSSLVLKGGIEKKLPLCGDLASNHYDNVYLYDLNEKCKEIKDKLESIAYEGIVGRDRQAQKEKLEAVKIDNQYFYMKYSQASIIEPAKVLNNEKAKELNLKVGIIQIGESIVRVEGTKDGKRNYTDVLESSIKMSFTTEAEEINIYLSPSEKDSNKIEVEIDDESEERLNKLKAEKKSLGENCLLGGKSVLEAIEDKGFKKNGNVPTESIETIKDVPFTDFTQACSQQINTRAKGK